MYKQYANQFYSKGLHVIPIVGKIPLCRKEEDPEQKKWTQLDEEDFLDRYPYWEKHHNQASIGLACGEVSNIIALDLDKEDAFYQANNIEIPFSAIAKTAHKNKTMFFRYNGEKTMHFPNLGIDLVSDMAFTAIPPSIHPKGMPYTWLGESLSNISPDDLPIISPTTYKIWREMDKSLKEINGIDQEGRNNRLFAQASMIVEKRKPIEEGIQELIEYDNANHSPPYFTDPNESHSGDAQTVAFEMIKRAQDLAKSNGKETAPIYIDTDFKEEDLPKKKDVKYPEPKYYLESMVRHICDSSYSPREKFALAASLSLIGTISSNKYVYKNTSPNLYQILIADSGSGKDSPLKFPQKMLNYLQVFKYQGMGTYRSDKAIVQGLENQTERIDIIDEISKIFRAMNSNTQNPLSACAEVLTEIWSSSTQLYQGQRAGGITTGFCHSPCISILAATTPNAFSSSFSKENVMQGFGGRFIYHIDNDKQLPRRESQVKCFEPINDNELISFLQKLSGELVYNKEIDVSSSGIYVMKRDGNKLYQSLLSTINQPRPILVPASTDAFDIIDELPIKYAHMRDEYPPEVRPIIQRAAEQVKKLALNHAIIRTHWHKARGNEMKVEITKEDMEFATKYIDACVENTHLFFQDHLVQSKFQQDTLAVKDALQKYRGEWVTRSKLTTALRYKFSPTQLYGKDSSYKMGGIIGECIQSGVIQYKKEEGKTRPIESFKLSEM